MVTPSAAPPARRDVGRSALARLVVVSPHLDDAVLGCGDLLAACPGAVVVTVFAGSAPPGLALTAWDAAAGFAPGDDVVARRRREDRDALTRLRARPVWLDFLDRQYAPAPPVEAVADVLARALAEPAPTAVLFPLGLFHGDHRLASEAALRVRGRLPGPRWLAYEDALYRAVPGLVAARIDELARRDVALRPARLPVAPRSAAKRAAVACYASQIRALATPGRPGHHDAFAPEACWSLEP